MVDNHAILGRLRNAGSILLGPLTPVAATDYAADQITYYLQAARPAASRRCQSDLVKIQNVTSLTRGR